MEAKESENIKWEKVKKERGKKPYKKWNSKEKEEKS